jgi:hypothetical protein
MSFLFYSRLPGHFKPLVLRPLATVLISLEKKTFCPCFVIRVGVSLSACTAVTAVTAAGLVPDQHRAHLLAGPGVRRSCATDIMATWHLSGICPASALCPMPVMMVVSVW